MTVLCQLTIPLTQSHVSCKVDALDILLLQHEHARCINKEARAMTRRKLWAEVDRPYSGIVKPTILICIIITITIFNDSLKHPKFFNQVCKVEVMNYTDSLIDRFILNVHLVKNCKIANLQNLIINLINSNFRDLLV